MEAAHLGARYGFLGEKDLFDAIDVLADPSTREFPLAKEVELVSKDGVFDEAAIRSLHAWQVPAFRLAAETQGDAAQSIGIPTWLYGHEPPTPFATQHAKYFANSIREDGLLAVAKYGVVYAPGSAGTLQEIYQDAAQNYYRSVDDLFSPMIFLDTDSVWTAKYAVDTALQRLFRPEDLAAMVEFVQSAEEVVAGIVDRRSAVERLPA